MKIIGYARVSKREQAEDSHALEQQIERLKAAGASEIYQDIQSGYKDRDRPNLKNLMKLVEAQKVNEGIVTRLDRLTRKGIEGFKIFDIFIKSEVKLRALDESFDLSTAAGRMTAGLLIVFAQHRSDQSNEAIRHGLKHLRQNKRPLKAPFGYRIENNILVFDDEPFLCLIDGHQEFSKYDLARDVVEIFLTEQSLRRTIRKINYKYGIQKFSRCPTSHQRFSFSIQGLRTWLSNPSLQGHLYYPRRQDIHYNSHAPLISQEELKEIHKVFTWNQKYRGYGNKSKYPLCGLVYCAECHHNMVHQRSTKTKETIYLKCQYNYGFSCSQKRMIRTDKVEQAIIIELIQRASDIVRNNITAAPVVKSQKLLQLESQLQGLQQLGSNPAISEAIADIQNQIQHERIKKQDELQINDEIESKKQLCLEIFSDVHFWKTLSDQDKIRVYRELVDKIFVRDGEIVETSLNF